MGSLTYVSSTFVIDTILHHSDTTTPCNKPFGHVCECRVLFLVSYRGLDGGDEQLQTPQSAWLKHYLD